ncbi:MAG TPA: DUF1616 domain-containing protein, partial [Methanobacteriaceae archaeon]|nr:DUF1616 domain-containing protein [Methanobacteriaceae archaeon]
MVASSQKDLSLVLLLSILGLAFLWIPTGDYPLFLFSYLLLVFLPGYTLINSIQPHKDQMSTAIRAAFGILLSLLFLIFIPLSLKFTSLDAYITYLPSILLILSILFGFLTYLRQRPSEIKKEGQLTLDEAIQRTSHMHDLAVKDAKETKKNKLLKRFFRREKSPEKTKNDLKKVDDTPLKEEPPVKKEVPRKAPEELKEISDSKKPPEVSKELPVAQKKTEHNDVKPLKDGIITRKDQSQTTLKKEQHWKDESHPLWRDDLPHDNSSSSSWDLFLVLILTGLSMGFLYLNPINNPAYTFLISYLSVSLLLG